MGVLEGKVAVITGASRGLGLAIAKAYAQEGAKIVVAARSSRSVEPAVARLQAMGADAAGQPCDVTDLAQVEALAAFAESRFGQFDIWVNNAALPAPYGPVGLIPPAAFTATTQTNIMGTYHGSLVALRHFLPRRQGKLINLLGAGDRRPRPYQVPYAASKSWTRSFTLALAKEYKESGVGIYAFNPGLMLTDMVTDVEAVAGWEEKVSALPTVLRILGDPPEVAANKALWIASPATDGRTGLDVGVLTPSRMLKGAWREGLRRLLGRQPQEIPFKVRTVRDE